MPGARSRDRPTISPQDSRASVRYPGRRQALGFGEQVGYSGLVESMLGHGARQGRTLTDWSRRPLDKRQIVMPIADVTHLATIFRAWSKIARHKRGGCSTRRWSGWPTRRASPSPRRCLEAPQTAGPQPAVTWPPARIAAGGRLKPAARNIPRGRIIKDDTPPSLPLIRQDQDDLGRSAVCPPLGAKTT